MLISFLLLNNLINIIISSNILEYKCSYCLMSVEDTISNYIKTGNKEEDNNNNKLNILNSCLKYFENELCLKFNLNFNITLNNFNNNNNNINNNIQNNNNNFHSIQNYNSRDICVENNLCELLNNNNKVQSKNEDNNLDIRISKGIGSRGYDKIRVSVISNSSITSDIFTYSQQFQYRWTQNYLNSGIVTVKPGEKTSITIGSQTFEVYIPSEGEGIRGILLGDPCFTSEFITCLYAREFDMLNHTIELLNAANSHDDNNFWMILGDNFYDQSGYPTTEWFSGLSIESKSKVMGSIPGNHDFWINSSPSLWTKKDQLANGFMQMYAQDVIASVQNEQSGSSSPYDFSHNPDSPAEATNIPPTTNFFWYYLLGNTAFIGYSGAHTYEETLPYLEESCKWAQSVNPSSVVLLGHWNNAGYGCEDEMTVPSLYNELKSLPACAPISSKMKYFMGHQHCNHIVEPDVGFMVGGQGMSDFQCGGDFGIPVLDTTGGRFKVYFFPIQSHRGYTYYQDTVKCFRDNGISGCYHLAQVWSDVPLI